MTGEHFSSLYLPSEPFRSLVVALIIAVSVLSNRD